MLTAEGAGVEAHRIGVVGAGVMGSEIARVAAAAGLDVTLRDVDAAALRRGLDHVAVVEEGPAPMGPFALGDLIGLDTPLHVQRDLEEAYGDRFAAGDELAALVARGHLGAKTGAGFLDGSPPGASADAAGRDVAERYYRGAVDEATRCVAEGVAAPEDTDLAVRLGSGWEQGPLEWGLGSAR